MRPFKAVRFSRNSKSGLIRNIINAGIRPAYEKVRSIFPYDKGDRGRSAEPTCERSLLFSFLCYKKLFILFCKDPDDFHLAVSDGSATFYQFSCLCIDRLQDILTD